MPTFGRRRFSSVLTRPAVPQAAVSSFNPATGFPWNFDDGERFVIPQFIPDTTPEWTVGYPPKNAVSLTEWSVEGGEVPAVPTEDPSVQAWSVGPPQNAVLLSGAFNVPDEAPYAPTDDPSVQAWSVGPPRNAVAAQAFNHPSVTSETLDVPVTDDTGQSYAIQPPAAAAFNPATGFPWNVADAELYVADQTVPDQDLAVAFGVTQLDPALVPLNAIDDAIAAVEARDDTAQSYTIQPPVVTAVTALTAWSVDGGEVQATPGDDPSVQAWSVGPPQNAVTLTEWAVDGGEIQQVPGEDPSVQPWPVNPPLYIPVSAVTAWPVDGGETQAVPGDDPSVQSWAVGTPLNAVSAQVFNHPSVTSETLDVPVTDPTAQTYSIQPQAAAFDPASVPWSRTDDIAQPMWWTVEDTTQAWAVGPPQNAVTLTGFNHPSVPSETTVPTVTDDTGQTYAIQPVAAVAFDPATVPWTGFDYIAQPAWAFTDDSVQAWSVGPPRTSPPPPLDDGGAGGGHTGVRKGLRHQMIGGRRPDPDDDEAYLLLI